MNFPEYLKPFFDNNCLPKEVANRIFGVEENLKKHLIYEKDKNKTILIVTGLSGGGKDSVVEGLVKIDNRFGRMKTCTTRKIRPEEVNNDPYIRMTKEEFNLALNDSDVMEHVKYGESYYFSRESLFKETIENFQVPILRIDPAGTEFYINKWRETEWLHNNTNILNLFVLPPSLEEMWERLRLRSESEDFILERQKQTEADLPYVANADYIVVNETGKLNEVVGDIYKLLLG